MPPARRSAATRPRSAARPGRPEVYATPTAFEDFVRAHRALGFTDFSIERPPDGRRDLLERIARETIPALRSEFAA